MARQIKILQKFDPEEFEDTVNSFLRKPDLAISKTTYRTDILRGETTRYMAIVEYERRVNVGETR